MQRSPKYRNKEAIKMIKKRINYRNTYIPEKKAKEKKGDGEKGRGGTTVVEFSNNGQCTA